MLKVIDVDVVAPYRLALIFSDGFSGEADLTALCRKKPFNSIKDFNAFSLASGSLSWAELDIAPEFLRKITEGEFKAVPADLTKPENIKHMLQDALWQAIEENRPDIFQGAIAMLVDQYGHSRVIKQAGIKSRTSAYRSLKSEASPRLDTLIKLGNAALDIAQST